MRHSLVFLLLMVNFCLIAQNNNHLQESRFRPFTIIVIIPDSAYVDNSLKPLVDSVEREFKEGYYSYLNNLGMFREFEQEEERRETEMKVQRGQWMEMEVHDFIWYQAIGMLSCPELQSLFNEYPWEKPSVDCDLAKTTELFSYDPNKLAHHYSYDYIVAYENIRAEKFNGGFRLRLTTLIYSKKDKKYIARGETNGHTGNYQNRYGDTIKCENDLQCLLETGIKSSTEWILKVISKRQNK